MHFSARVWFNIAMTSIAFLFRGGGVVEWALDLKPGDSWLKYFTLPLSGFILGTPEVKSSTALCKKPTGQPPTSWDSL